MGCFECHVHERLYVTSLSFHPFFFFVYLLGMGASPELLLQNSQMKTSVLQLEKRETQLEEKVLDLNNQIDGKDDQLRGMRMELAKQKKTIQKLEKKSTPTNASAPQSAAAQFSTTNTTNSDSKSSSSSGNSQSTSKKELWQEKARAERELLGRAKKYVESQKKEIRRRQRRIERGA